MVLLPSIRTHALKNSLIPTITVVGLNFATLVAGTVLIEATFSINGIGTLFIDALFKFDYWVTNALIFIISVLYLIPTSRLYPQACAKGPNR